MLKQERHQLILDALKKDAKVVLAEISKQLKVSEDTVRRDIKELSNQKLLREVRGGAIPHAPGPVELKERINYATGKKQLIAQKAVKLIKQGQSIILDSGTSALAVADALPENYGLTVFTNSYPIVNVLEDRKDVEVYFAGGRLFRESLINVGHDTISFFESIRADICFLGICSIHLQLGVTGHFYDECAVKKAMIKSAGQVIALSTPEKINTAEAFHICPASALTGMVTSSPDSDLFKPYKEEGIKIW